jgi:hypothetical protein
MWTKEALKAKHEALLRECRTVLARLARAQRDAVACEAACRGLQQVAQVLYGVDDLTRVSPDDLERTCPEAPPLAELVAMHRDVITGGARADAAKAALAKADDALRSTATLLEAVRNLALGLYHLNLPHAPPGAASVTEAAPGNVGKPKPRG